MADLITTAKMSTNYSRSNSMATTAFTFTSSPTPPLLQPSRISSEAPEVLPSQPQPPQQTAPREDFSNGVLVSSYSEVDIKRSGGSRHQKQVDTRETETRNYPLSPRVYDWEPTPITPTPRKLDMCEEPVYKANESWIGKRRTFKLITMVLLVVVAFLLGGGIGGGIGGALLAKEKMCPRARGSRSNQLVGRALLFDLEHKITFLKRII